MGLTSHNGSFMFCLDDLLSMVIAFGLVGLRAQTVGLLAQTCHTLLWVLAVTTPINDPHSIFLKDSNFQRLVTFAVSAILKNT